MQLGLNLGSGQRPFKSTANVQWVNIDAQAEWKPDIVADCNTLFMINDASVDYAVLHHCIEHEGCGEANGMLKECHRVLHSGGSVLVFVPDNVKIARAYVEGRLIDGSPFDEYQYNANTYGAFRGSDRDRHRWSYSPASLLALLSAVAPWQSVGLFDWRPIEGADIAHDDRWILGAEAVK